MLRAVAAVVIKF